MGKGASICCLDMEGVLVPEIWIEVSRRFKIEALKLTTRDVPDYDQLMKYRLGILRRENIKLRDVQKVIGKMRPLPGAKKFLTKLRRAMPVIILSDTYYEFAGPLMQKLDSPALFCNWLKIDKRGFISGYVLRQRDGKKKSVIALKSLGFNVKAAGDSYNDLTMLRASNRGVLFNPPQIILKKCRGFSVAYDYDRLLKLLLH